VLSVATAERRNASDALFSTRESSENAVTVYIQEDENEGMKMKRKRMISQQGRGSGTKK
jgi:hypothetical protein